MAKWKKYIRTFIKSQPPLCSYSRLALFISGYIVYGLIWCIIGGTLYLPYTSAYIEGMAAIRAAAENIPAVLFAGVIAAIIGDAIHNHST